MTNTLSRRGLIAASALIASGVLGTAKTARGGTAPMASSGPEPIKVAFVLGPRNNLIDLAGPWEILSSAVYSSSCPGFEVYSVAPTRDTAICDDGRSFMGDMAASGPISGLHVVPDFTFDDAPLPRIVIVGGRVGDDDAKVEWIRRMAPKVELTASVCTGAFLLAKAGLLDGKSATTNRNAYDEFAKSFPKVKLVRHTRFVDAGTVATSTGLTAGIDLALHIIERFYGRAVAQDIADYEEWPGALGNR